MNADWPHIPVLLEHVCRFALPMGGKVMVDATVGCGGHAEAIIRQHPQLSCLLGIDRDAEVLDLCRARLTPPSVVRLVHGCASDLPRHLAAAGLDSADGILLDLGFSSFQVDNPARGFAFQQDGPLDMRMDTTSSTTQTASDLVNSWSEEALADIFFSYGEEPHARRIARAIVRERAHGAISRTGQLAQLVATSIPGASRYHRHRHPATKVFQALRIAVNGELEELDRALPAAFSCLSAGGHLSVISFHSLEDRRVKQFFHQQAQGCICPPKFPVCTCNHQPRARLLTRRPLSADPTEIEGNPRSRSARLRVLQKLPDAAGVTT